MALTSISKYGFSNIRALIQSIANEMTTADGKANGQSYFSCVYPPTYNSGDPVFPLGTTYPAGNVIIFESKLAIDPLANAQTVIVGGATTGAGLTVDVTATAGAVSSLTINTGGANYLIGDIVSIDGGTGGTAKVTAISGLGTVSSLSVQNGGSSYNTFNGNLTTVLETTAGTVNAAWRLAFVLHNDVSLTAHAGSRLNLPGIENPIAGRQGKLTFLTNRASDPNSLEFREPPGCINVETWSNFKQDSGNISIFGNIAYTSIPGRTNTTNLIQPGPNIAKPSELFISRLSSTGAESSYPMNYQLTMSNRGMVLVVWEDNQEEIPEVALGASGWSRATDPELAYGNSPVRWFVIQRAVDREKGWVRGGYTFRNNKHYRDKVYKNVVYETSRCPVFCVFGNADVRGYRKFVVRENDALTPSPKRPAVVNTVDSPAIINPWPQQSVTEQGEFVVTFLNNLSTSRFRYGDELDLIGTVGAEVVGSGTNINVKVYNDSYTRTYTAFFANRQYGNGMRIMVLTSAHFSDENNNAGVIITDQSVANGEIIDNQYK